MPKKIFVTGGAGYVGSHSCVELLKKNHDIMIFDDLSNSSEKVIDRIERLSKRSTQFSFGDIRDEDKVTKAMCRFKPDTVLHFAGLKAVEDSVLNPLNYYDVNVQGTLNILKSMIKADCCEIVFSSSASVYDSNKSVPYRETSPTKPVSPYGRTKLICEGLIEDWTNSGQNNQGIILRYFNPVGAHESGLIGEDPKDTPNNLMPIISQVASRERDYLTVFGKDYATRDGSGERDFIHVVDLAHGHIRAIDEIRNLNDFEIINLGSGRGTTVLELVKSFEKANKVKIPVETSDRRPGDVAKSVADSSKAFRLLQFKCAKSLNDMCLDAWNWQIKKTTVLQ